MTENHETSKKIVSKEMICSIAGTAAAGVDGVEKLFMRLSDEILDAIYPSTVAQGVKVTEMDEAYVIDLYVITRSQEEIPKVAEQIQIKVKESVETMADKAVSRVNVHVQGSGKY